MKTKKFTTVLYIVLALAVLATSVAWRPAPVAPKGPDDPEQPAGIKWPPQYTHGRLSARLVGDEVYISGNQLPRRHDFFVKVRRSGTSSWERLGVSYSDGNGNLEDRYRLPQKLRKLPAVQVCMKDVLTNKAYCITARR